MGLTAAVAGASGYAGGELLRLLLGHPELTVGTVAAGGAAGRPVTDIHPHLTHLAARSFLATDADAVRAMGEADVVFLCLPHGESAAIARALPAGQLIVDLGADHRLADATAWERFYATPYAGRWTYGLPELPGTRPELVRALRIAAPGCYPTAVILGLAPLLAAGLVETADIVVVAASGTSGAGRGLRSSLMGSEVMGSMSAYKAGGAHQHTPEMEQALTEVASNAGETAAAVTMSFTPVLAPMPRGILATSTARLRPGVDAGVLGDALHDCYDDEPFVHVLPSATWPQTGAVLGSNAAHVAVAADLHAGRAVVVSAIDNLGKGAAGQAVQCANLALGLPEHAGLTTLGLAP